MNNLYSENNQAISAIIFSNIGHTFAHLFTILYATAVLYLPKVFDLSYGELLGLSSLGLVLFGVAALPAGWLGDRWSKVGMMSIYFFGIGFGAIVTGIAQGPNMLFVGLTLIGLFASIYHPVGIAWIVSIARKRGMTLGINGVFGNIGGALSPVFVGVMIDYATWRMAFILPGVISILIGLVLLLSWFKGYVRDTKSDRIVTEGLEVNQFLKVFIILTITMACSGFVYTGLTNIMPKLMEMGLSKAMAASYTQIGLYVGLVLSLIHI